MMADQPTPEQVSKAFRRLMQEELGSYKCTLIDHANDLRGDDGTCASHDHCDANMVMEAAFRSLGVEVLGESGVTDDTCLLWNKAWDHARSVGFNTLIRD